MIKIKENKKKLKRKKTCANTFWGKRDPILRCQKTENSGKHTLY